MAKFFAHVTVTITIASFFLLMFSIISMVEAWEIAKVPMIIAICSAVWIAAFSLLMAFLEK
jgi:hypothetical protein